MLSPRRHESPNNPGPNPEDDAADWEDNTPGNAKPTDDTSCGLCQDMQDRKVKSRIKRHKGLQQRRPRHDQGVNISIDTPVLQFSDILDLALNNSPAAGLSRKPIAVGSSDPPEGLAGATPKTLKAKGLQAVVTIEISVPTRWSDPLNANSE
ncbi:hypothetical protein RhiJN_17420 [Ceratobasidium sp. AG-Ba]|nr:hypothetical protein RhiJN_17420 [Ceratobasidium sp. AG-Ba]